MIRLEDTSGSAVSAAIAAERHRMGSPATGMVLTLLILADEEHQADATAAAVSAALQHPMRIVTLVPRPEHETARLDAERLLGWAIAHAVLSAWWSLEENEDWRHAIECAGMFARLD